MPILIGSKKQRNSQKKENNNERERNHDRHKNTGLLVTRAGNNCVEFVDDLRAQILTHYRIQITEHMKENRNYAPGYYEDFEEIKDEDIPF